MSETTVDFSEITDIGVLRTYADLFRAQCKGNQMVIGALTRDVRVLKEEIAYLREERDLAVCPRNHLFGDTY